MPSIVIGFCLLAGAVFVAAAPHDTREHIEFHVRAPRAPRAAWYHQGSHPVHALFKRAATPGTPGSQEWASQYPQIWAPPMPEASTPKLWLNALQTAEQAGQIPNITIPRQSSPGSNPNYGGQDPTGSGPEICSSTAQCQGPGDEWSAPNGVLGIGFDDGPSAGSAMLYQFLQEQDQEATHFMIGINILTNPTLFNEAYTTLKDDIAVHTWTHPYMTTLNNSQVVAELGWTMQIIHDLTGGRVPRYWRPPYGDSDNRVRAIAKTVFGLTQIDWSNDSEDWSIATGSTTLPKVIESLNRWYTGPKSPGLIILEHELDNNTSGAFIETYGAIKANNWTAVSTVALFDGPYQNADGDNGTVLSMDVGGPVPTSSSSTSSPLVTPESITGSSTNNQTSQQINNKSGVVHIRGTGISTLLLLVCAFMSIFR